MSIAEGKRLYWELAINRKLRETAFAEHRIEDANHYARCVQATELKVRRYLEAQAAYAEGAPLLCVNCGAEHPFPQSICCKKEDPHG